MDEPGRVPDEAPDAVLDVGAGFDTDGDGSPDTAVTVDGIDLVVAIDLDGDRFADQVLRIGPDATVREVGPEHVAGSWCAEPADTGDQ